MLDRLKIQWLFIRDSLWFVPLLMSIAAVALALFLTLRPSAPPDIPFLRPMLYNGDADSARSLLSALLSAMITMATLVVSITMVVITLAAGQLGPRVIRYFIADVATQVVLGLFVATILYVLVVLRALDENDTFSNLAVTVATASSGFCVFVLLFFIHRVAKSIMADNVVRRVNDGFVQSIATILPERETDNDDDSDMEAVPRGPAWVEIPAEGYIQAIEIGKLVAAAAKADAVVWLMVRSGHYLLPRGEQIGVTPATALDDELKRCIRDAILLGAERTPAQDLEFGIRQLVEIGLRALSPGINDPFTAIVVIDYLMAGLARILGRAGQTRRYCDGNGALRVVRAVSDTDGLVGAAFNQLRQAGHDKPAILIRMTDAIAALAPFALRETQFAPLRGQIDAIEASARASNWIAADLAELERRLAAARDALSVSSRAR